MNDLKEQTSRTAMLIGEEGVRRLARARVAVFGVGGVGGYACEALARAGVGAIDLFDSDTVSLSNINRQIIALHSTVGRFKTEIMRERIEDIDPDCRVHEHRVFYLPENADAYPLDIYDYVVDAIDTVSAKVELAVRCQAAGVPLISSMGTGNKLDPSKFTVTELFETSGCPLARAMRQALKKRGVTALQVVFSNEQPITPQARLINDKFPKTIPASISFVPPAAGLLLAAQVVKGLLN